MDRIVSFLVKNPDIDVQISASCLRWDEEGTDIPRIRLRMTRRPAGNDKLFEESQISRWYPAYDFAEFADYVLEEMADILRKHQQ